MNYKYGKWLQREMVQFPHQLDVDPEGMVVLQCALEISAEHSDSYIFLCAQTPPLWYSSG